MAILGISAVVLSLAAVISVKGSSLREKDLDYLVKEENLEAQVENEKNRAKDLEQQRIYVQTKQYIEKVAKEKLGLVKPDEILLKPSEKK